jgi:hypothetical protein
MFETSPFFLPSPTSTDFWHNLDEFLFMEIRSQRNTSNFPLCLKWEISYLTSPVFGGKITPELCNGSQNNYL